MSIKGSFSFNISDSCLNFEYIRQNLNLTPTKIIKKGQNVGRLMNKSAPFDIWTYEKKIFDEENPFSTLDSLLQELTPYTEIVRDLKEKYQTLTINCYLRSDFAQIGFEITPQRVCLLKELGIGLSVHILSYGGVED